MVQANSVLTISWKRKDKNYTWLILKLEIFFLNASGLISEEKTFYTCYFTIAIGSVSFRKKLSRRTGLSAST